MRLLCGFLIVGAVLSAHAEMQVLPPLEHSEDAIYFTAEKATQQFDGNGFEARGSLMMRSGSWQLHADRAEISGSLRDPETIVVDGAPARILIFEAGSVDEPVEGHSDSLEFNPKADDLRLRGDARIVRSGQIVSSDSIRYHLGKGTFTAGERGRVRVVTQPP